MTVQVIRDLFDEAEAQRCIDMISDAMQHVMRKMRTAVGGTP